MTISKYNQFIILLKDESRIFLGIGFAVFLFILFFQPFPLEHFDFNNRILVVAGLGAISFFFMMLIRIGFIISLPESQNNTYETILPSYLGGFLILSFSSVAYAFYIRYVGIVEITFYIMFKVVLICLAPPVLLRLHNTAKNTKSKLEELLKERDKIQKEIQFYRDDYLNKPIQFMSENSTESINLLVSDVAFIKSADNYVEIVYKEGESFRKKLLRNTLKNIEVQTKPYSNFIRCHRICIVNSNYLEKLNKRLHNYLITIKGYNEEIPVSRQYLLKLKEAI